MAVSSAARHCRRGAGGLRPFRSHLADARFHLIDDFAQHARADSESLAAALFRRQRAVELLPRPRRTRLHVGTDRGIRPRDAA